MEERPLKHLRLSRRLFRATLKTKLTPFARDKLAILERAQIYSESEGELNICALLPSYVIDFAFALLNFWRETALSYGLFRKRQAEANAVF